METTTEFEKEISTLITRLNPEQKREVLDFVKDLAEEDQNASIWEKRFSDFESGLVQGISLEETEAQARQANETKKG